MNHVLESYRNILLQGTWETPSGKYVNYIVLKDTLESKIDISRLVTQVMLLDIDTQYQYS